jgi:hypothetical protein
MYYSTLSNKTLDERRALLKAHVHYVTFNIEKTEKIISQYVFNSYASTQTFVFKSRKAHITRIIECFNELKRILDFSNDYGLIKFYHDWKRLASTIIKVNPINQDLILAHSSCLKRLKKFRDQAREEALSSVQVKKGKKGKDEKGKDKKGLFHTDYVDVEVDLPSINDKQIEKEKNVKYCKKDAVKVRLSELKEKKEKKYAILRREKQRTEVVDRSKCQAYKIGSTKYLPDENDSNSVYFRRSGNKTFLDVMQSDEDDCWCNTGFHCDGYSGCNFMKHNYKNKKNPQYSDSSSDDDYPLTSRFNDYGTDEDFDRDARPHAYYYISD